MFGAEAKKAVLDPSLASFRLIILEFSGYDQQLCLA